MTSRTRSGAHVLTVVALAVSALSAFVSALFVRELITDFLEPGTGYDYRTSAFSMLVLAVALVVLAGVSCLGRGAPLWLTLGVLVLALVVVALAVHDASVAGSLADQGDPGFEVSGALFVMLVVPTSWPLVVTVVVRPVAAAIAWDQARTQARTQARAQAHWAHQQLRGPSYPAPR